MDRVGEQGNATGEDGDHRLEERRRHQADEGPLQRPHTPFRRGNRGINHTVGVAMPRMRMVPAGMVVVVVVTTISVLMRMTVAHRRPPRLIVLLYVSLATSCTTPDREMRP